MSALKLSILALGIIGIFGLSACGTLNGAGRDLEAAGQAVQKAVK